MKALSKLILWISLIHFSLYAQTANMENIGQNIQTSLPKLIKGKNREIVENIRAILAVELLCAAQAIDLRKPERLGAGVGIGARPMKRNLGHIAEQIPDDLPVCRVVFSAQD